MTQAPPIPQANTSPYPQAEPPHTGATGSTGTSANEGTSATSGITDTLNSARAAVAPLPGNAAKFAKARPFAAAALVGTVALALFGTLRGRAIGQKKAA
jgi:hypothetical protein